MLIGQAWGASAADQVRRVAGTVLVGTLALSCVLSGMGQAGIGTVLRLLGTAPDILPDAIGYARVMLLALPFLFLQLIGASLLRGMGDTLGRCERIVRARSDRRNTPTRRCKYSP